MSPADVLPTGPELARLLTRIEAEDPHALARAVRAEAASGDASHIVGLTGPPGVGKSTLTGALIQALRARELSVAVLAVDPSSRKTGGAVLGDRLRMLGTAPDPCVFIRSMASRGRLGGLSTTAPAAVAALAGAGFDLVLVEAVGSGQNEIDLADVVDTTVVVAAPGMGDSVQALKAGLLEVGDVFVVNKADRSGAGQAESQLRTMLAAGDPQGPGAWVPPVSRSVAVRGEGIAELIGALDNHRRWLRDTDRRQRPQGDRLLQVLHGVVMRSLLERLADDEVRAFARQLANEVACDTCGLSEAAELLLLSVAMNPVGEERP